MFLLRYVTKLNENVNTCCEFIFNLTEKYRKVLCVVLCHREKFAVVVLARFT